MAEVRNKRNSTGIAVSMEVRELLRKHGHKGETYDTILRRIIKQAGITGLEPA